MIAARSTPTGTTFSRSEIENLPGARNPWDLAILAPGVLSDATGTGGSAVGQSQSLSSQGSFTTGNTFLVDGFDVTDLSGGGTTPQLYNMDAIEEFQVLTEQYQAEYGRRVGAVLNVVTKSGGNDFHGTLDLRFRQSEDLPSQGFQNPGGGGVYDWGGDQGVTLGGPILRDRLFFFGAFERRETNRDVFAAGRSTPADFTSNGLTGRLRGTIHPRHTLDLSYLDNGIDRLGVGASDDRGPAATWNEDGTFSLLSARYNGALTDSLAAQIIAGTTTTDFDANPAGGGTPIIRNGVFENGFFTFATDRTARSFSGSLTGILNPQWTFKGGLGTRRFEDQSRVFVPGGSITSFDFSPTFPAAILPPQSNWQIGITESWGFGEATFRPRSNLTVNFGVRWEGWDGENEASVVGANPLAPDLVPEARFDGNTPDIDAGGVAPRLGFAWDLEGDGRSVIRGGWGIYYDRVFSTVLQHLNPIGRDPFRAAAGFLFSDTAPADQTWTSNENRGQEVFFGNIRTDSPGFFTTPNRVAGGLDVARQSEWSIGVERQLWQDFLLSARFTHKQIDRAIEDVALIGDGTTTRPVTSADGVPGPNMTGTDLDGSAFLVPTFTLNPAFTFTGGTLLRNGARERTYDGFSIGFNRPLADGLQLRGFVNFERSTWDVPNPFRLNNLRGSDDNDDGPGADPSEVNIRENIFLNSPVTYNVMGLYQICPDGRFGLDVSANLYRRDGFRIFPFGTFDAGHGPERIEVPDDTRYESVLGLDLRFSRQFALPRGVGLGVSLDIANAFNSTTVVQRNADTQSAAFGEPLERLNPRVWQVGARVRF